MSKVAQFYNAKQVEAEACAWIAQLDGAEPSKEDLDAYREWLQRSPLHRSQIKRLLALWGELNILTELAEPRMRPSGGRNRFSALRVAAALVVVLVDAYVLWPRQHATMPVEWPIYATVIGERKPLTLSDGSKLLLNTDSRVQVEYSLQKRVVRLLQGEAYFEVAHNPMRPFLVYAGVNVVRAVGTAFSVHVQRRDISVVVTQGAVELSSVPDALSPARPGVSDQHSVKLVAVKAGQGATVDEQVEALQTIEPAEVTRKLSWREGVLSFSGEPLEQVVEEVSRYTPVSIIISDPRIRNVAIGGYFKAGETDAMFEALETSFGVRVTRVNDRLVYLAAQ